MSSHFTHERVHAIPARRLWLLAPVSAILGLVLLLALVASSPVAAQADDAKRAQVIVQFDDTASVIRSVEFTTPITGLAALQNSGLQIITNATEFGTAVCSIQGVGCPAEDCFCKCSGGDTCEYWSYSYWDGVDWAVHDVGADVVLLFTDGAIEGWRWGEFGAAMTPVTPTQAAGRALDALRLQQATDGVGSTTNAVDTMLAAGANQLSAEAWTTADGSLQTALMADTTRYMRAPDISPAAAGKIALAAAATGACWPLSTRMPLDFYDAETGAYSEFVGISAWAMLGTLALGDDVPPAAVATLKANLQPDGGWEWMTGFGSDTNTTALAIQVLIGTGEPITATEVISGLTYLAAAQNSDGGFSYDATAPDTRRSDVNSTSFVIQALLAADEAVDGPNWQTEDGNTPMDFLLSMQLADGTFAWQPGSDGNTLATQQAVPALLGQSYPLLDVFAPEIGIEMCRGAYLPLVITGTAEAR